MISSIRRVTGLQDMMLAVKSYIGHYELNFNRAKIICEVFSACSIKITPKWFFNDSLLNHSHNSNTCLGPALTGHVTDNINIRIQAARVPTMCYRVLIKACRYGGPPESHIHVCGPFYCVKL